MPSGPDDGCGKSSISADVCAIRTNDLGRVCPTADPRRNLACRGAELMQTARLTKRILVGVAVLVFAAFVPAHAHNPKDDARLSKIGPAPDIALTDENGKPFSLA